MAEQRGRQQLEDTLLDVARGQAFDGNSVTGCERMLAALAYTQLVDGSVPHKVRVIIQDGVTAMGEMHRKTST